MDYQGVIAEFINQLGRIQDEIHNVSQRAFQSVILCRDYLSLIKKEVVKTGFANEKEEIHFFKRVKPIVLSQLIYQTEIHNFELFSPKNCIDLQRKLIKRHLKDHNLFFLRNIDFGQYIEMGRTHFDSFYFTRKANEELPIISSQIFLQESEFNTSKDTVLAQIKAYGLMTLYLKDKLSGLSKGDCDSVELPKFNIRCVASKTDIIELIYSLIASGAIKGNIKELVRAFELIFDTELGDYSRTFIEIRNRINGTTKFLDSLKMALSRRMEEIDN